MDAQQALDLVGELPASGMSRLWEAARPLAGPDVCRGLWLGRNAGMPAPLKWMARRVVKRDWFAKLVLDDFGVNVRVAQDGTHRLRQASGKLVVDLPFALAPGGLDYGLHALGTEWRRALVFRDVLRSVPFDALASVVSAEDLARVALAHGGPEEGELLLGYMAPMGVERLRGTPFGMVWWREATPEEDAVALDLVGRRRFWGTGAGVV